MDKVTFAIVKKLVEEAGMIDVAQLKADVDELYSLLSGKVILIGETTTALTDQATTNPIMINGVSTTAVAGNLVIYNGNEFVFDGTKWVELGSVGAFGNLAYKDSVSTTYTPKGIISKPIMFADDVRHDFDVTPEGTITTPEFNGTEGTVTVTGTASGTVTAPEFTGTEVTIKSKVTAAGTVSKPDVNVTPRTTTVNSINSVGSLPTLATQVTGETLRFVFGQGALPVKGADTTVMTGATAALASAPEFKGSQVEGSATYKPSGTVSTSSISGGTVTASGKFTPEGSVSTPEFNGKQKIIGFGFKLPRAISPLTFTGAKETIVSQ